MARDFVHLAARAFETPLLIHPRKAETIAAVLAGHMSGVEALAGLDASAAAAGETAHDPVRDRQALDRFDGERRGKVQKNAWGETYLQTRYLYFGGIALISVDGTLVNRGAWIGAYSGLTSYEGLALQLASAAADPDVTAIVLDIDSPGGEATGAFEFADLVRKTAARVPVVAVVNGMAASAAYAMASAATRIVMTPSSWVGSIGVVMLHLDRSKQLALAGVAPTLIFAGDHKVDGNPFAPLPADVRAEFQADIDKLYSAFVDAVAAGRPMDAAAIRSTQARTYQGAEAIEIGLADAIGTLDDVVAEFSASKTTGGPVRITSKGPLMSDITKADHDAALAAAKAKADADLVAAAGALKSQTAAAASEAKSTERARIAAIVAHPAAHGRGKLATHLAMSTDMAPEAAAIILEAAGKDDAPAAAAAKTHRLDAIVPNPGVAASGGPDASAVGDFDKGAAEARALLGIK